MRRCLLGLLFVAVLGPSVGQAQDKVYLKSKKYLGKSKLDHLAAKVQAESPEGVRVQGVKELIPADEIVDIEYQISTADPSFALYRGAFIADRNITDPKHEKDRKANFDKALKGYQDTLGKLARGEESVRRNLEYRIGYLLAQQARQDAAAATPAIAKLKAFKESFPGGWQIVRAMQLLANLQLEQKQFADAQKTFEELAELTQVAEGVRYEAKLSAARIGIRSGKVAEALKKLEGMIADAKLGKDSPLVMRARVAQAECLVADKETLPKGRAALREIIKDSTDKGVKASAYNTLGVSHFKAGEFKEARWEFLWVDVVYNQDPEEHARALYYLWRTFKELGEAERAQECLENLLSERQFAGLEYQVLAQRENKSS